MSELPKSDNDFELGVKRVRKGRQWLRVVSGKRYVAIKRKPNVSNYDFTYNKVPITKKQG